MESRPKFIICEVWRELVIKNILVVIGGGRPDGNTVQLANAFSKGAEDSGHKVEKISLQKIEVRGCIGCNACRFGKLCVQRDNFNDIVPMIKNADLIAFSSPLYYWTISSKTKAFVERFYCIAEHDPNPPLGRYEKYPVKDSVLLMTAADDFFWTFEQAVSYYNFALINYIGFHDKGMVLAGGCGDTNGKPQINKTNHLTTAYEFGKSLYKN
jgi:multimeric flavodoxin WrbA